MKLKLITTSDSSEGLDGETHWLRKSQDWKLIEISLVFLIKDDLFLINRRVNGLFIATTMLIAVTCLQTIEVEGW